MHRGNPFAFTLFPYPENEGNTGGVSFLDSVSRETNRCFFKDRKGSERNLPGLLPVAFRGALARLSGANEGRGPGEGSLNKTNDHNSSRREVKAG